MKERAATIVELADAAMLFYRQPRPDAALLQQHLADAVKPALARLCGAAAGRSRGTRAALSAMLKEVLAAHKLKMPQLAMPLRLLLTGQLQTPSIDAVVELFGRDTVLARLSRG